jgi:hypothetical protein
MIKIFKKTFKWIGIIIGVVIVVILLVIGVLAIPGPFFPDEKQYRAITVYSETPIEQEIDSIMAEVFERLDAVPIYNPNRKFNLSLCSTQDKFSFFARLTFRASRIMGFSLWGNSYVNGDFLKELAVKTGGRPKYSAREGSVVHAATHELMHGYLSDATRRLAPRSLPEWKVEGYCEYGVNQFVAPRDKSYTIPERIDVYLADSQWNLTASTHRPHYIWGLMIEYLINVKGMSFNQVMADSVTFNTVYNEIMDWRDSLRNSNQHSFSW